MRTLKKVRKIPVDENIVLDFWCDYHLAINLKEGDSPKQVVRKLSYAIDVINAKYIKDARETDES